ncbi:MAG: GIY-YIG nuclease family protein [Chloroflexi bacterium]|nr:GIY-YIG nuclease family protein [Chloroflexota bacterium]
MELSLNTLPAVRGTYVLLLELPAASRLTVGRLGIIDFPAGWYAYVGSAFGPGGLRGRLKHHLTPVGKPHWHVDYLRQAAHCRELWIVASDAVYEHAAAVALMAQPGAIVVAPRFGASDCGCPAHLIHFAERPDASLVLAQADIRMLAISVGDA